MLFACFLNKSTDDYSEAFLTLSQENSLGNIHVHVHMSYRLYVKL